MPIQNISGLRTCVHSTHRAENTTSIFGGRNEVVLLDFLGAKDYFITDFGAVFNRKKLYPSINGNINRCYLPMVVLDAFLPYKWVLLPTTAGGLWLPTNQLLGWAFAPQTDEKYKYFLSNYPSIYPCSYQSFEWKTELPEDLPSHSHFRQFMTLLYPDDAN